MNRTIALLTDFGYQDGFVGVMKGVIHSIYHDANIIDISHDIKSYDIYAANWVLSTGYKYFPPESIFVCVIDPGVGSNRRSILIEADEYYLIGPDNGVFTTIIENSKNVKAIQLDKPEFWLSDISKTFHGRDIFAPVAAYLAKNDSCIETFGTKIRLESLTTLKLTAPVCSKEHIIGTVVYIDHFGNLITDIPADWLVEKNIRINIDTKTIYKISASYIDEPPGHPIAIYGSHGFLEIATNSSNAAKDLNRKIGQKIHIDILDDI